MLQTEVCTRLGLSSCLLNVSLEYLLGNRKLKIESITSVVFLNKKEGYLAVFGNRMKL